MCVQSNKASLYKELPRKTKCMNINRKKIIQGYIFHLFFDCPWSVSSCMSFVLPLIYYKGYLWEFCVCVCVRGGCNGKVSVYPVHKAIINLLLNILTSKNRWNCLYRLFLTLNRHGSQCRLMCALTEILRLIWYQISQQRATSCFWDESWFKIWISVWEVWSLSVKTRQPFLTACQPSARCYVQDLKPSSDLRTVCKRLLLQKNLIVIPEQLWQIILLPSSNALPNAIVSLTCVWGSNDNRVWMHSWPDADHAWAYHSV